MFACALSFIGVGYTYLAGLLTAYGDVKSRLLIARSVTDGLHPGVAQLGGVWLPLPQLLMLPFTAVNGLYASGFAGSFVSMASYLVAVIFLYRLIHVASGSRPAAAIGALTFATPNVLYMQSVAMSEMPFIALTLAATFYLLEWTRRTDRLSSLLLAAAAIFLATLTRYEGWILLSCAVVVVAYRGVRGLGREKTEALLIYFGLLASLGVVAWFTWNQVIFGDALYFIRSEYAVREQFLVTEQQITQGGDLNLAFLIYAWAVVDNSGWIAAAIATLGLALWLLSRRPWSQKLAVLILLFPMAFFTLALFKGGIVVIQTPRLLPNHYQNIRYGLLMLPAIGFFAGIAAQRVMLRLPIAVLLVGSALITWNAGAVNFMEAQGDKANGDSAIQASAADWIRLHYDGGLVLGARRNNEALFFETALPLSTFVYEGDRDVWEAALNDPNGRVRWVLMRRNLRGIEDKVWQSLHDQPVMSAKFELMFHDTGVEIYRAR